MAAAAFFTKRIHTAGLLASLQALPPPRLKVKAWLPPPNAVSTPMSRDRPASAPRGPTNRNDENHFQTRC
jgi:hypothetical protein